MRKWVLFVMAVLVAAVAAGCMSDKSERSARKAAIGSEPPPTLYPRLEIAGNRVNVRSFSFGIDGPQAQALQLVRLIDENSPPFFRGTAEATNYQTATLTLLQSDGTTAATYVFSDVVISSFQNSMSAGDPALEALSLTYQKLNFTYGSANACFDFPRQRAC